MDLKDVQTALNASGCKPPLAIDGKWGALTAAAVDAVLAAEALRTTKWTAARKRIAAMQVICRRAGIDVGNIDGLEGPQTRYAFEVWDARLRGENAETWRDQEPAGTLPPPVKTIWPLESEMTRFFGSVGKNQTMLEPPWQMVLAWDPKTKIRRFQIHEKVHDSAVRVLDRTLDHYGLEGIHDLGLHLFGGCLNVRAMKGGTSPSIHSWGTALDFDPERNQLRWGRDKARLAQKDARQFWAFWEEEGWVSLGRALNYDWMHVQAARR